MHIWLEKISQTEKVDRMSDETSVLLTRQSSDALKRTFWNLTSESPCDLFSSSLLHFDKWYLSVCQKCTNWVLFKSLAGKAGLESLWSWTNYLYLCSPEHIYCCWAISVSRDEEYRRECMLLLLHLSSTEMSLSLFHTETKWFKCMYKRTETHVSLI